MYKINLLEECFGTGKFISEKYTKICRYSDRLRAGRSGIESRCGRDFLPVQTGPGAYSASCKMDTGSFQRVKCGRGVLPQH